MARTVELDVIDVVKETDAALCVELADRDEEVWIPKSVVSDDSEVWKEGDTGTMIIAEWFAEKEGLI